MDLHKMIKDLKDEKDRLMEAILTLERLAMGGKKRRGRPPAWMKDTKFDKQLDADAESGKLAEKLGIRKKHRHPFTKETRKRMTIAQKKRWATVKKGKA